MGKTATASAEEQQNAIVVAERPGGMHLGEPAYKQYDSAMIALVKKTLMPASATDADLYMLLELAATYKLDPFTKEIWAVEMKARNASGGKRTIIMIGRDGMLAIAQRSPDYRGIRSGVIREKDEFAVLDELRSWGNELTQISHKSSGTASQRGEIVAAFCEVYRKDMPPVHFIAEAGEYRKSDSDYSPWKNQPTVMLQKVAIVSALRMCFRVSGLYIQDEMTGAILSPADGESVDEPFEDITYSADPLVDLRMRDLFAAANAAKPGVYTPGKQRLLIANLDEKGVSALIAELERFIIDNDGTVPAPPDPEEVGLANTEAEEDIEDAEFTDVQTELPT